MKRRLPTSDFRPPTVLGAGLLTPPKPPTEGLPHPRTALRSGFTLLELVLAITIGVVLLGALYLSMATHFYHADSGRVLLDEETLVRTLLTRMASDISSNLGPLVSLATDNDTASDTDDAAPAMPMAANVTMQNSGPCNLGVQGDSQHLVLTVSRLPRELDPAKDADQANVSDLRRITYWLIGTGPQAQGLARQEITRVTGPDADSTPPDVANPESYIIAARVQDLTLEYYDGSTWQSSWDGTTLDAASQKPLGPPAAIAITITLRKSSDKQGTPTTYRHVVAIPTANRMAAGP